MSGPIPDTDCPINNETSTPALSREEATPCAPPEFTSARDLSILSTDECLHELSRLAELVHRRMLKPQEASVLRGIYDTILRHSKKPDARQKQTLPDTVVRELLQSHPTILSQLEPLLTDEQTVMIMEEIRDAPG